MSRDKSKYEAAEKEFNELVTALKPTICTVSPIYEAAKLLYIMSFACIGYSLCYIGHKHIGLSMLCLSLYQAGWVGHDYSHRSILTSPARNNMVSDVLGWLQGYTDDWWKARHNTHHMVTNEVGNDPDVRTEPVFHFYDKNSGKYRKHIPMQHIFFTALLGILDVFWRYESIMMLMKKWKTQKWIAARLSLHYVFLLLLVLLTDVTVWDLTIFMYVRGFMTAAVVFANHYPEDRLPANHKMGLFEQTLRTSRNTTGLFTHSDDGWARYLFNESTGFLSMQIEHHMVPTWPSGKLMELRPHIRALAKKYDLPYKETSLVCALRENISKLSDFSFEYVKHIQ